MFITLILMTKYNELDTSELDDLYSVTDYHMTFWMNINDSRLNDVPSYWYIWYNFEEKGKRNTDNKERNKWRNENLCNEQLHFGFKPKS